MDLWLIRTAQNYLAGPYTKEQVLGLIQDGKLTGQDEVCLGNDYWFYLSESEEVKSKLGLDISLSADDADEEITETKTGGPTLLNERDVIDDSELATNQALKRLPDVNTNTRAEKQAVDKTSNQFQPLIVGKIERFSIWKIIIILLVVLFGVLTASLLSLLKS